MKLFFHLFSNLILNKLKNITFDAVNVSILLGYLPDYWALHPLIQNKIPLTTIMRL